MMVIHFRFKIHFFASSPKMEFYLLLPSKPHQQQFHRLNVSGGVLNRIIFDMFIFIVYVLFFFNFIMIMVFELLPYLPENRKKIEIIGKCRVN